MSTTLFALAVLAADPAVPADDLDRDDGRWSALVHARVGNATTPFAASRWPMQRAAPAFTFIAQGSYAVLPELHLGLRVPVVGAYVQRPAGSLVGRAALGNIELSTSWRHAVGRGMFVTVAGAVGAPATGSTAPAAKHFVDATLALGSALEGWRYPQLFAAGRLPVTATVRFDAHHRWFHAGAGIDLPLLLQIGAAGNDPGVRVNPVGFVPVLGAHLAASPRPWFFVGVREWTAIVASWPASNATRSPARVQAVLQPQLGFVVKRRVVLALDSTIPLGGPLGGGVYDLGLHVGVRY